MGRKKLEYVEQVEQGETSLQIYVEQVEQEQGGLSTWNKWNKDKESVQQNLSTCAKVGLQGREFKLQRFHGSPLSHCYTRF